ncbi:protein-methionine-sulfoxide reductase catalytic subunit MsrP [Amantichitinum ursilacus]|uniref:Protein-methionine-sulfoxide reductase catalytic subunit MsrP n=1 Tax=Amantichitinum ursilacus TaxID=857265 RepID=A0A0N0XIF2_9NEIS|nr:protein-methionine-sulfoxide reductase catalytic subunit MsrP [Amantichitinum ursilacus]KPC52214.1 Sulfoxide reductase catalytic subunit YedY precursor [Amantichitinum ursilacus]
MARNLFKSDIAPSDITPEAVYADRRRIMQAGAALAVGSILPAGLALAAAAPGPSFAGKPSAFSTTETRNSFDQITHYNNFYEFGTDKEDPAANSTHFQTRPWSVRVEGECMKPQTFDLDALLKLAPLEERVYRLRCVEAWSMVIPWEGFPLADLLKVVQPTSKAKFVEFTSLADPKQMPGVNERSIDWPYTEGLRIDEAMHPLTLIAVGLYGKPLPNPNGAPIRVVVPWKYGFKSAKSIIKIRLLDHQPATAWNKLVPSEYGFYSNVNPEVDHPRWSQASERRIGEILRRKTLMFNGYGDQQVAGMYKGMDLKKFY